MKTITLDFETYEKELECARIEGFASTPKLIKELETLMNTVENGTKTEFYEARYRLNQILYNLKKDEK